MDISNVTPTTSTPDAAQPTSVSSRSKTADDIKSSNSIQIQPGEDKQKDNFTVGEIDEFSKELNSYMDDLQTSLGFFIREELDNLVVVEIKNRKTGELIRQIPPEELLKIREKMVELTMDCLLQKV